MGALTRFVRDVLDLPVAFLVVVVSLGVLVMSGCSSHPPIVVLMPDDPDLFPLTWLTGAWVMNDGDARVEEHWTQPSAGTMFGVNRTVRGGETVFFEFLAIEKGEEGIVYRAWPRAKQGTPFPMKTIEKNRVVFENPEHDYPTRIMYWLAEDGALHARIEGERRGQPDSAEWVYRRARFADTGDD